MQIPVRCLSCGKVIGDKWNEFKERTEDGEDEKEVRALETSRLASWIAIQTESIDSEIRF